MVLIWLNKAVKFTSILINTLSTHRRSAFTNDLPVIKIRVAHLFSFLCSPVMFLYIFGSVLWFPHTNDFRLVSTSSCLINVICVGLRIVVSNHIVLGFVFLWFFLCLVSPALLVSLDCPFCITTSVFSIVYWH